MIVLSEGIQSEKHRTIKMCFSGAENFCFHQLGRSNDVKFGKQKGSYVYGA